MTGTAGARVLVTGGAGFIGSNTVRALTARGHSVGLVDDLSSGFRGNLTGLDVQLTEGTICDRSLMKELCAKADVVLHLAARGSVPRSIEDPEATNEVNVDGTVSVLEAARSAQCHVIFSSSSSVYGANPALPKSEDLLTQPMSPYAVSKLAAESYTLAYQRVYGLPTLAFRFFNVYGPGQTASHDYAAVIPRWIAAVLRDQPVRVFGDGQQSRDFTFVGSVVDVLVDAVERRVVHPSPVNLAFGTHTPLIELLGEIETLSARKLHAEFLPMRAGDVLHSQADPTTLRHLFPTAAAVPLREGLRATLRWFEEQGGSR